MKYVESVELPVLKVVLLCTKPQSIQLKVDPKMDLLGFQKSILNLFRLRKWGHKAKLFELKRGM